MRLWLARGTSISLREQLSTQLLLGILSGRYKPGGKLPSVRELARRLQIHSNTVSAAYRDLAKRGWVTPRTGSGVFVRSAGLRKPESTYPETPLDEFVQAVAADAAAQGFALTDVQEALARFSSLVSPQSFIVADPDLEFARVLAAELSDGAGTEIGYTSIKLLSAVADQCALINAAHRSKLPGNFPHKIIRLKSMEEVLAGQVRPSGPVLIAVVSRSEEIHRWSSKLLAALGFSADSSIHRNPDGPNWQDGLAACGIVAADKVAAAELPAHIHPVQFRLVADDFIEEIREQFAAPAKQA